MPSDPQGAARARERLRARLEEMGHNLREGGRIIGFDPASADGDRAAVVVVRPDGRMQGAVVEAVIYDEVSDMPTRRGREIEEELASNNDAGPAEDTAPAQQELALPMEEYRPRLAVVDLDRISVEGPILEPTAQFVENVRRLGVTQPVALVEMPNTRGRTTGLGYTIAAGRRRVRAAGLAGLSEIPALIFPAGTPLRVAAAIALSENAHRAPNPITDLEAIETLAREGYDRERIAHALRIPLNVLDARMVLGALSPAMRTAVANGRIAVGVAQRIARLPAARRAQLEECLAENGRVTGADVREVMQARTDEAIAAIPDSVFGSATDTQTGEVTNVRETPAGAVVESGPVVGEFVESTMVLHVSDGESRERRAEVRARLTIDPSVPVAVDVGGMRYVPETTTAMEFQGEARIRARSVSGTEVARTVVVWPNRQQTTVEVRRPINSMETGRVIVGGAEYRRPGREEPADEVTVATPDGAVTVRCELDENGLQTWLIGGQEYVSREGVEAADRMLSLPMTFDDDDEEGWAPALALLARVEQVMPAAPDAASDTAFALVMEAMDHVRALALAERRASDPATAPIDPAAAAAALAAQEPAPVTRRPPRAARRRP